MCLMVQSSITVLFIWYFLATLNSNLILKWERWASVWVKLSYILYYKFVKRRRLLWMRWLNYWGVVGLVLCVLLSRKQYRVSVILNRDCMRW